MDETTDEKTRRYEFWERVIVGGLLGTGVPGLVLALIGMISDRSTMALVGYILAAPLMAVMPVLFIGVMMSNLFAWFRRQ